MNMSIYRRSLITEGLWFYRDSDLNWYSYTEGEVGFRPSTETDAIGVAPASPLDPMPNVSTIADLDQLPQAMQDLIEGHEV